jgi:Tol biopolymer transport system component
VVLFEMLTGKTAFSGKDVSEILAAVIRVEPEWKDLPANLHWRIRELMRRCLEKEARDRYGGISDARVDIEKVLTDPGGVFVQLGEKSDGRKKPGRMLLWIAAAVVLTAMVAVAVVWNLRTPEPPRVMRFSYELPEDQQFNINPGGSGHTLAVSPDGGSFVYSIAKRLYLRSVGELNAGLIAGTGENPQSPFFSPDGQWIGYWSPNDGKLKKITIRGGAPVTLCDVGFVYGAIWYPDDAIVFADVMRGILRVSSNGGSPEVLDKGILTAPQLLADGKSLIYTDIGLSPSRIILRMLGSDESKELLAGSVAQYLPTGHLVYWQPNSDNLFAVPFDLGKLEVKGGGVPVVEEVLFRAISGSGTLVYMPGTTAAAMSGRTLFWVDRKGKEEPLELPPDLYRFPRISPDGMKVALTIVDENWDIWILDRVRKTQTRLTFSESTDAFPVWTPDGKRIVFYSERNDEPGLYWKAADGTGEVEKLCSAPQPQLIPYSWSGDGKGLITNQFIEGGMSNQDIMMLSMEGDRATKPILQDKFLEIQPKISPDGRWMAYVSNESGKTEVYVRPFPDVNKGRWQVSTDGGDSPIWSPNGRELFYLNGDAVMAVSVDAERELSLGTPELLFRGSYV